jgi:hypothetical protein
VGERDSLPGVTDSIQKKGQEGEAISRASAADIKESRDDLSKAKKSYFAGRRPHRTSARQVATGNPVL